MPNPVFLPAPPVVVVKNTRSIKYTATFPKGDASTAGLYGTLPIDAHRDEILDHVRTHRVTVIHGETGCGKSSRLPTMLFEDGRDRGEHVRMFVSQPRRAAARALFKRVSGEEEMAQHVRATCCFFFLPCVALNTFLSGRLVFALLVFFLIR